MGPLQHSEVGEDSASEPLVRSHAARRYRLRALASVAFGTLAGSAFTLLVIAATPGRRAIGDAAAKPGSFMELSERGRFSSTSWEGYGLCGIATNMLDASDAGMTTFCDMDLDFWWNWDASPKVVFTAQCAWRKFLPMIWGISLESELLASAAGESFGVFMGYNEPDLWGPPAYPGGDYLSSGSFAVTFHCGGERLGRNWQALVTAFRKANPNGIIVTPAMADPSNQASTGPYAECDESPQLPGAFKPACLGWLRCFKENVIRLPCGETNCWDAIDVLQFHAYEYESAALISKVKMWESYWADDLTGANGRTRKTLWLTEFAHAGTYASEDPDGKGRAFMKESVEYLKASPYVSAWSWFSQTNKTFASFPVGGKAPTTPFWASELVDAAGQPTVLGKSYADMCRTVTPKHQLPGGSHPPHFKKRATGAAVGGDGAAAAEATAEAEEAQEAPLEVEEPPPTPEAPPQPQGVYASHPGLNCFAGAGALELTGAVAPTTQPTAAACQQLCDADAACGCVTYLTDRQKCWKRRACTVEQCQREPSYQVYLKLEGSAGKLAGAPATFQKHPSINCWPGNGGELVDGGADIPAILPEDICQEDCRSDPLCSCVTFKPLESTCWKRGVCVPAECRHDGAYDVYVKVSTAVA